MTATGFHPAVVGGREAAARVRRLVNEEIARLAATRYGGEDGCLFEFLCECGDLRCPQRISLTLDGFREAAEGGSLVAH